MVKLFNAVQQSQVGASVLVQETKVERGRPSLSMPMTDGKSKGKGRNRHKDDVMGRAKDCKVTTSLSSSPR